MKVIALSDEPLDLVEPYVEQFGLPFTVGAESPTSDKYGVTGIPHTVLIDADGTLVWRGSPGGLSKGVVKKALKGAKHPKMEFFAVHLPKPVEGRASKAADLAGDGQLAAALEATDALLADEKASEEDKQAATGVKEAVEKHVQALRKQVEKLVKARDPGRAIQVLEALSKEFGSAESGAAARKRAEEIAADPKVKAEIEAGKALDRLKDQIRPLKRDKAKPKIEEFAKKYAGTRAAERAKYMLQPSKSK